MIHRMFLNFLQIIMEIWKTIEGYEYEVSTFGNVRRVGAAVNLKPWVNKDNNYLTVGLCKNDIRKKIVIHRLVACTFIPNPEGKPCVDHINRIRTDNRLENLRWVTYAENNINMGLRSDNKLGHKNICLTKNKKYLVHIEHNKSVAFSKRFSTLEEAITARDAKLTELGRTI